MSKSDELRTLYEKIQLDSTEDRKLLSKVKNGSASQEEIDHLLDIESSNEKGGKILDDIKKFETALVSDMNKQLEALEEMETEYLDSAHCENESEKNRLFADMKKRYKKHVAKAEEILEAIKKAYFQVRDFDQFERRLYDVKESLAHFE